MPQAARAQETSAAGSASLAGGMPVRTPPLPKWPTLNLERELAGTVCGVDEAGVSPLAGPVVAAAVILPRGPKPRCLRGLTDSKLLTADARERFYDVIRRIANVGVGIASVEEIDRLNIYHANMLAMRRAVEALGDTPDAALVDGLGKPPLACPTVRRLVKGDRRSLSIAAASVIAKVTRDRLMHELAPRHPHYGWESNVGYGTDTHYLGLLRKGPTEHHRRSFAPMTTLFAPDGPVLSRFRFCCVEEKPDLGRPELLELRPDLHAVFDGTGHHVGVVKFLRGTWTFRAVGYDETERMLAGCGPCADFHGARLPAPEPRALLRLFS
jgi:ribonuclease HII